MTPPESLRVGVIAQLPGCGKPSRENKARLNDTCALLEDLGHVCTPVKLKYDHEAFNESSIRLWAVTLGFYMEQFARMTGRKINARTVEAVTLEVYRYAKKMKALEMEWAMGVQNSVSRAVGAVMRDYDVLLTPGLAREVAELGELNQNASNLDTIG